MSDKTTHYGLSFTELLLIVFIVLKLTGVINWSWWWVLSPLWISLGIVVVILIGFGIYWIIKK
jgi:hypothetical protein